MDFKKIIKKLTIPGEKLSQRAVSAGVWGGISRVGLKAFSLIRNIILARLLAPEDFGLFGIALIVLSFLDTFTQHGMAEALIQKKEANVDEYLDTAWTIKMIRGFVLAGLLFILAPWIAKFFKEPGAVSLLHIVAIALIMGGFGNLGTIYFSKNLDFHKRFIYDFCSVFFELVVSIALAFMLRNAFALAYGYLAGVTGGCILSYFLHPYRPKIRINWAYATELMHFGKWVWGRTVVGFFLSQGVPTFIGRMYPAASLGIFQMANSLTKAVTTDIPMMIHDVSFPLFSKVQDRLGMLQSVYIKNIKIIAFILTPAAFYVIGFTDLIVLTILGDKWIDAIPVVKILMVLGLLGAIGSPNHAMIAGLGRPDVVTKINIFKLIVLAGSIYPLSQKWGLEGAVMAALLTGIVGIPIFFVFVLKRINVKASVIFKFLCIPFLNSTITLFSVIAVTKNLDFPGFVMIILNGVLGGVIYLALSYLADLKFNYGIRRFLNKEFLKNMLDMKDEGIV